MLNVKTYSPNPTYAGLCRMERDIVFSTATGTELKLQLIRPEIADPEHTPLTPVIVFVQGSGWTFPVVEHKLPMMGKFACEGIAVAMVTHRSCLDGHPFPAFLQDVKTAIRFVRANAEKWHLDPDRIGIWGTSSGGNTALLCGVTGDDPTYKTDEYADVSDAVKSVADCFGPSDLVAMFEYITSDAPLAEIAVKVLGEDRMKNAREMSPYYRVVPGGEYPPFLLLHGDADPVVPYEQSVIMTEKLLECGAQAELICVKDGLHEGNFWNPAIYDEILGYFKRTL